MIKEIPMYTVICDRCGADHGDGGEYAGWGDADYALECAEGDDWYESDDNKHFCPDCYFWDDNDDETPTIKTAKP